MPSSNNQSQGDLFLPQSAPCRIDELRRPSVCIARVESIAAQGDTPDEAAKLLAEQLEERALRIRRWILGEG